MIKIQQVKRVRIQKKIVKKKLKVAKNKKQKKIQKLLLIVQVIKKVLPHKIQMILDKNLIKKEIKYLKIHKILK